MDIGKKLKELRLQNDLTLGDLASRSELTKGFLSQVERNLTMPSIATLEDILEALGTNLSEFFHEEPESQIVFSTQDFFVDEQEDYSIEWVIPNAQKNKMEPILVEMAPGGETVEEDPHEGEEFGYVLSGTVKIVVGDCVERVRKDESFYFQPTAPHRLVNAGKTVCKVIWVSTPPSF